MPNRLQRWAAHIIQHWPRLLAYRLFGWATRQPHDEAGLCFPCLVKERKKADAHLVTTGPNRTQYCSKCGLEIIDAPPLCANRVLKINNPKRTGRYAWFGQAFWE